MNNVMGIRLISGEEIIAKVENIDGKRLRLIKPSIFAMAQGSDGRPQAGLADYIPLADKKEIIVDVNHILFEFEPKAEIYNAYNSLFGSGLVIPKTPNIFQFTKPQQ